MSMAARIREHAKIESAAASMISGKHTKAADGHQRLRSRQTGIHDLLDVLQ